MSKLTTTARWEKTSATAPKRDPTGSEARGISLGSRYTYLFRRIFLSFRRWFVLYRCVEVPNRFTRGSGARATLRNQLLHRARHDWFAKFSRAEQKNFAATLWLSGPYANSCDLFDQQTSARETRGA